MKKTISLLLCIIMLLYSFAMPSFALTYNGFSYEIIDEKAVITGYNTGATTLTIPATINGVSVVAIGDNAFKNNTALKSVVISEGIQIVGASAFENCTALAAIQVPSTIMRFGEKAIYNTAYYNNTSNWKLKTSNITSGGDIQWEDIAASVLEYLYLGTILVEIELKGSYSIKYGTLVVADGAFKGNYGATGIGFPSSLKVIGENAFEDCIALEKLDIPESVSFFASSVYNTGYYNNSKNWENDVLYMGTRVVSTMGDEAVIKNGVTQIISGAINSKRVVIPESVTDIHKNAFANAENQTIFGYANSYAQAFANQNNLTFINLENHIKGDVDFNGVVDSKDYKILCDISILEQTPSFTITLAGDMNEDGTVDGLDVIILDLFINNIGPSTIKGDADGNGEVNDNDYTLLIEIVTLNAEITDIYMFDRCDLNYDGAVDSFDALYLDLALNRIVPLI